jgi:uncharacterized membrane protein YvbJ
MEENKMFCKNCGATLTEDTNVCPNCGAEINQEAAYNTQEMQAPFTETKLSWKALVGFIVSLAGIIVLALPCGIVGLIFSALGFNEVQRSTEYKGRGFALAGIVVAIIDVVVWLIGII